MKGCLVQKVGCFFLANGGEEEGAICRTGGCLHYIFGGLVYFFWRGGGILRKMFSFRNKYNNNYVLGGEGNSGGLCLDSYNLLCVTDINLLK